MKVYVFMSTSQAWGNFETESLDTLKSDLENFATTHTVKRFDYLEIKGQNWTITKVDENIEIKEGLIDSEKEKSADTPKSSIDSQSTATGPEKKRSNAGSIGGLIGFSLSIWLWFFYDVTAAKFFRVSAFDYILSQVESPDAAVQILWGFVGISTLVATLLGYAVFRLIFR
jgi:hypothetical protein